MWYRVFYTNRIVRKGMSALTIGPLVFIRPEKKEDQGLLAHELTHVRQFYSPRKWFAGKLAWEVEAYREQLKYYPERIDALAWVLAHRYGFNLTEAEAKRMLEEAA